MTPNAGRHEPCLQIYEYRMDPYGQRAGAGATARDEDEDMDEDFDEEQKEINENIVLWVMHMEAALGKTKFKAASDYEMETIMEDEMDAPTEDEKQNEKETEGEDEEEDEEEN
ncbi:hypothetical protein DL98DRAFT_542657 [Cadophora sp. DSE1049]|nr:hypothetical protein DL98DRAFT_542657 [Cadophora sp. DSE1049]